MPELYPDEQGWSGLADAMRRAVLHFDLGVACGWDGCPQVGDMSLRGYAADVWLLLVSWLVAAAPLAAMGLRLVVSLLREQEGSDHVRTAIAKGVPHKRVIRRNAGPFAHSATASLVGISAPIVVINLILVERVFGVPGFFVHTWRATGRGGDGYQDGFRGGRAPTIDPGDAEL